MVACNCNELDLRDLEDPLHVYAAALKKTFCIY